MSVPNLPSTVQQFAAELCRGFAPEIKRDARWFEHRALFGSSELRFHPDQEGPAPRQSLAQLR